MQGIAGNRCCLLLFWPIRDGVVAARAAIAHACESIRRRGRKAFVLEVLRSS